MSILITGGCGFIGSHTVLVLLKAGYSVIVADNLSNSYKTSLERVTQLTGKDISFYQIDVCNTSELEHIFKTQQDSGNDIDTVIHFAGLKSVEESTKLPLKYYSNNLSSTFSLLQVMEKLNCKSFVFSSSATVYGNPASVPITEDFPVGGVTNPYGRTKLMIEDILRDIYAANPTWDIALLRYFNPVGAHPSGLIGEDPQGIPNNLVPYISQVASGVLKCVSVFGNDYPTPDGTGVRDYIHVMDLASGHLAALRKLQQHPGLCTYNLGTGQGYSVLEMIHAFEKACGQSIPYTIAPRRSGDIAACWADTAKAKRELGWEAAFGLDEMMRDAWNWQKKNPNGFKMQ